jgi:hypothetical protein
VAQLAEQPRLQAQRQTATMQFLALPLLELALLLLE